MRHESFSLNPYEVLGISPNASTAEIQTAYRQHALRWHPDRNPNDDYAMRMMQRVNAAWDILKDEHGRAAYDRWERGGANTASGPDAWGQPSPGPPPGSEWYRPPPPPPSTTACPRCQSFNEPGSIYCYSCGLPFDEARQQQSSPTDDYAPQYDASNNSKTGQLAGFWIRLVASLIDVGAIIVIALFVASVLEIPISEWSAPDGWNFAAILSIAWLLGIVYFTVLIAAWSTTLGKQIFGLRVVRTDGSKIGICRAFARVLCFSFTFSPILLGISSLMIAFRQDKRGLHDLISGTEVVYR